MAYHCGCLHRPKRTESAPQASRRPKRQPMSSTRAVCVCDRCRSPFSCASQSQVTSVSCARQRGGHNFFNQRRQVACQIGCAACRTVSD
eukprot:4018913-Prymnesium_polylepis.1